MSYENETNLDKHSLNSVSNYKLHSKFNDDITDEFNPIFSNFVKDVKMAIQEYYTNLQLEVQRNLDKSHKVHEKKYQIRVFVAIYIAVLTIVYCII